MSWETFVSWAEYSRVDLDEVRADRRMARLASVFANIHRGKDKPVIREDEFMLYPKPPQRDKRSMWRGWMAAMKARGRKKRQ